MYVPSFLALQPVTIKLTDGTDMNGAERISMILNVKARVQTTNTFTYTAKGQKVALKAKVFVFDMLQHFKSDTCGKCTIDGKEYAINAVNIHKNPDNSVNHVKLELI